MRALFDVNVLIALLDQQHVNHRLAFQWLELNGHLGWATCPLTQNGCMRIMSQQRYPNPVAIGEIRRKLHRAAQSDAHAFLPDDVSLLDDELVDSTAVYGHRQLTDIYLLALSVVHGCRLVTFDQSLSTAAVRGADGLHLVQL